MPTRPKDGGPIPLQGGVPVHPVLHSRRASDSLPSPQLLRRYSWLMVLERAGPCVHAARAKPRFGSIARSRLFGLELIDRRPPEGKERGGANAAPSLR